MSGKSLLDVRPRTVPPLDPDFVPAVLALEAYDRAVRAARSRAVLSVALERENGLVQRGDLPILAPGSGCDADTLRVAERHVKTMLWAYGGWKLHLSGPEAVCGPLARNLTPDGARKFDIAIMARAYDHPFEVCRVEADRVPGTRESEIRVGGHLDGCRIGFDLGASDYKLAAVIDGAPVFSAEIPWDPVPQKDPLYHAGHIADGLKQAALHLPRVNAIGGSSAGIYVDNRPKVASLFRSIPDADFQRVIAPLFLNLAREWGVPLVVANDGDVSALAGAMSLGRHAMLGVAMGSSEAAGFLDRKGCITGWLNELAFAPVDFNPCAAVDEWSGDAGVGALYFSQQAVNKLAPAAGFAFPAGMPLPERLKAVQEKANAGDRPAQDIFVSIGVYFGYAVAGYARYYDCGNLLMLGRVTSGRGGELILEHARAVLSKEFPAVAERIALHVPDEKSRRVGQAVAAASLPEIGPRP